ncbi:MAG: S41 family peptidase [Acidobacteriota bacterium]|nr:S41 family peptidase [Acidobacteriota bacterium]MDH3785267.1 S41 family peptidase [Acidobacteriota bacterium]
MTQPRRSLPVFPIAVLIIGAIVGGMLGSDAQADAGQAEDQFWTFGRVLSLVEEQYVGELESDELVENAIAGLLQTLDPHSNYLNPESFSEMRDEQRGKFSGLGIQITKRGADKPLTVIAPIDGTPASRAGLQSGDVISKIEGEPTIELTVQDAVRLLKGPKGSEVTITIERPGLDDSFDVTIGRDDIPIESIRVYHMLADGVGYVRIANFTSTTVTELDTAVTELSEQGMGRLLLDLRGNPGGLLEQAVQVSDRFVGEGDKIVFTRGRVAGSNQDYFAQRGADKIDLPLIVLVNGSSASASEIVSGAIQDHDLGLVVGETTFGKGLVQRVIPLRDGGALAVTTAKYFTPSGRLIQRDYTDVEQYYMNRNGELEPGDADDIEGTSGAEIFFTDTGRKVFGGGGIHPDHTVENDNASQFILRLFRENQLFDFSVEFLSANPEIDKNVALTDEDIESFRAFLTAREVEFTPEEFAADRDLINLRLRAQIARIRWDANVESRVLSEGDKQIQKAIELFEEAEKLRADRPDDARPKDRSQDRLRADAGSIDSDPVVESESQQ